MLLAWDEAVLLGIRRLHHPWLTPVMLAFTRVGDTPNWTAIGVALYATGGEAERVSLRLAAGAGVATAVAQTLKRLLRRARPDTRIVDFEALAANPDGFSFPSGHTTVAFSVAVSVTGSGGPLLGPLAFALAAAVGSSRVYLGAHFPLDVLIGAALGSICGLVARSFAFLD